MLNEHNKPKGIAEGVVVSERISQNQTRTYQSYGIALQNTGADVVRVFGTWRLAPGQTLSVGMDSRLFIKTTLNVFFETSTNPELTILNLIPTTPPGC